MSKSIRFYSWSDLHIDYNSNKLVPIYLSFFQNLKLDDNYINILLLTGDIANPFYIKYDDFMSKCSNTFTQVFYIAGNHEYYIHNNDRKQTINVIKNKIIEV